MAAEFDDFKYPDPVQGGDQAVTRQRGLPRSAMVGFDPVPPAAVVQGDHLTVVTRQVGSGAQRFDQSGTLIADSVADDGSVLYLDHSVHAVGEPNPPPPGLARTNAPLSPPSAFGEMLAAGQQPSMDKAAIRQLAEAAGFTVSDSPLEVKDAPGTFVIASDAGAVDDRDRGDRGPQVFSASDLPVVKKRAIVPVTVSVAPAAAGAPPAPKAKKGGRK
jgi:hypothetical protein